MDACTASVGGSSSGGTSSGGGTCNCAAGTYTLTIPANSTIMCDGFSLNAQTDTITINGNCGATDSAGIYTGFDKSTCTFKGAYPGGLAQDIYVTADLTTLTATCSFCSATPCSVAKN
jgi:hypothetical protein